MRSMAGLRRSALLAVTMWAFAACSDEGGGSLKSLGIDDGASEGVSTSEMVTGEKDVRLTLRTGALLQVPMGAVDKATKIGMERPADGKALDLVARFKTDQDRILSAPYVLTPHGTKFKEDVTVTLPLAKSGNREVTVAWLENENDKQWKRLSLAKSNGKKAEVTLKHFSVLVLIEDASDLPDITDIGDEYVPVPSDGRDGGTQLGTGADDDPDVGQGSVRDASAGTALDGDVEGEPGDDQPDNGIRDGGSAGQGDGGTRGDAGTTLPDAGDVPAESMPQYDKLLSCGAVNVEGTFTEGGYSTYPQQDPLSLCVHRCFGAASCLDAQIYRCDLDAPVSTEVAGCLADCVEKESPTIYCPENQTFPAVRCDGYPECQDGRDEANCDPSLFVDCGDGSKVPSHARCDNEPGCSNGADEQGCFTCDGGWKLPPWHVCDGVLDCSDMTDEVGCAEISCSIITI